MCPIIIVSFPCPLKKINFGEKGEGGKNITIAGVELPRKGFSLCRACGKVQIKRGEIRHTTTCPLRTKESEENILDCVYLYREFSSEAIRILLPLTSLSGSERILHSFIAALHLGLKCKFGGKVEHLKTTLYEEPIEDSSLRKKYLMLFDTIPGGSGYLKELMRNKENMLEVFHLALSALKACICNKDPDKDGCYRCLFAYRTSFNMEQTSRDTAIELLSNILENRDKISKIKNLRDVKINVLFDSELENRFIEAFEEIKKQGIDLNLSKELVNGKPGYFLKINGKAYYIQPQVSLRPEEGVVIPSKADFIIYPARERDKVKPIALFTDGYLFHKDRIAQDIAQRMSIVHSNKYYIWSLTWKDVESYFHPQGDYFRNYLNPFESPNGMHYFKTVSYTHLTLPTKA